jgi:hypothetical protein
MARLLFRSSPSQPIIDRPSKSLLRQQFRQNQDRTPFVELSHRGKKILGIFMKIAVMGLRYLISG